MKGSGELYQRLCRQLTGRYAWRSRLKRGVLNGRSTALLDALDSLDLASNTLVLFTRDNGAHWIEADIEQTGHRANEPLAPPD